MTTSELLAERVTNSANVSVGTSLAMETILPNWPVFDPMREAPPKANLQNYVNVYFNLWTLARNLQAAVPLEGRNQLVPAEAGEALAEEAWEVAQAVINASAGAVKAIIYYPSYKSLEKSYPKGKLRIAHTDKQKASQALLQGMCDQAAKILETNHKANFRRFDVAIKPDSLGATLIFTHFPSDLLNEGLFGKVALLESHTGLVKQKNLWYTKLFAGKTLSNIPLNPLTLQVFGDDHQFHPWGIKFKAALLEMAQKYRWSWTTTNTKMRMDVRGYPDQLFAQSLEKLL